MMEDPDGVIRKFLMDMVDGDEECKVIISIRKNPDIPEGEPDEWVVSCVWERWNNNRRVGAITIKVPCESMESADDLMGKHEKTCDKFGLECVQINFIPPTKRVPDGTIMGPQKISRWASPRLAMRVR
jgi:hypothetical protein